MQETALHPQHLALGARLLPFAGWNMPIQYTGIVAEHQAVRQRAGLFDLSHMGELWVTGPDAAAALAYALVSDPTKLSPGRAHYSMLCEPGGGILDDLVVYRLGPERFMVVANASNVATVVTELRERFRNFKVTLDDATLRTSLVAIQGPRAAAILKPHVSADLSTLKYYGIVESKIAGVDGLVARTGYTGEDGFELYVPWADAVPVWETLLAAGAADGLVPAGLGARDTLRLEAGMPLYGQELTRETTPYDAGLGRVVKLEKPGDFVGRAALTAAAAAPRERSLVGLRLNARGIPRVGYAIHTAGDGMCGTVTSGTASPTLGASIAMGYVPAVQAAPDTPLDIDIRGQRVPAQVVSLPFYRRTD